MSVLSTDSKDLMIVVDSIDDVSGPTNVSPASYAAGWRASVRAAGPNDKRTFVVVQDSTGAHVWQEQLTAIPVDKPDQRFTVASAAYDLDAPGINTFLTLEDGIAGALAGTGTTLPPPNSANPRFVWIQPDTYPNPGFDVELHAYVHLNGCVTGAASAILQGYSFRMREQGPIVLSGIAFSQCSFTFELCEIVRFVGCTFDGCSLSHRSDQPTKYVFEGCTGDIPTWNIDNVGPASVVISGLLDSRYAVLPPSSELSTKQISMVADGSSLDMIIYGSASLAYSANHLVSVSRGSIFSVLLYSGKITATGASPALLRMEDASSAGIFCHGNAVLPQTAYVADSVGAGCSIILDLDQCESSGITSSPFFPAGINGPGTVDQQTSSGSRPRGFTAPISINCQPGDPLATQTGDVAYGAFDRILVRPNYRPLALNPNTAAAAFQFASLLLIDPSLMPIGKEIDIINDRDDTPDLDGFVGGPVALRLPDGTASRIGFMKSYLSSSPVFSSESYVILDPGQSVKLTVDRDALGTYRYMVSAVGAATPPLASLESQDGPLTSEHWYFTTKESWTLLGALPGAFLGNNTSGYPIQTIYSAMLSGIRFYWASAAAATVRATLRNAAGAVLASVDVPVAGVGDYSGIFANVVNLSPFTTYWITIWETSGTNYMAGVAGAAPARFLVAPQALRGWVRLAGYCWAPGNAVPVNFNAEQPMLLVPLFNRL